MANITRWDQDFNRLQSRLNRLFEEAFRSGGESDEQWGLTQWAPPVDVYEKDDELVFTAELPGVRAEDLKINLENNVLTLHGERRIEKDVQRDKYHRLERAYGTFSRSFTLPPQYDSENVQARFSDGELRVRIPRSEKARPRSIPIAAGEARQIAQPAATQKQKEKEELAGSRR